MQAIETQPAPARSLRFLGEMGDIEIEWTEESDERMRAVIQKKMDQGIRFFQVTVKGSKAHRTRIKSLDGYAKRRVYVADEDIEKAFLDGAVRFNRLEGGEEVEVAHVEDAAAAARGRTVGMRQYSGG